MTGKFTHTDYYLAALSRKADLAHLRKDQEAIIFSVYCAGVAIECMLRAYILKYTKEFDDRHDLERLFRKSMLGSDLEPNEKEKIAIAIKKANEIWNNNLRYASSKRMKRLMKDKVKRSKIKDPKRHFEIKSRYIFEVVTLVVNTGVEKWN